MSRKRAFSWLISFECVKLFRLCRLNVEYSLSCHVGFLLFGDFSEVSITQAFDVSPEFSRSACPATVYKSINAVHCFGLVLCWRIEKY